MGNSVSNKSRRKILGLTQGFSPLLFTCMAIFFAWLNKPRLCSLFITMEDMATHRDTRVINKQIHFRKLTFSAGIVENCFICSSLAAVKMRRKNSNYCWQQDTM